MSVMCPRAGGDGEMRNEEPCDSDRKYQLGERHRKRCAF